MKLDQKLKIALIILLIVLISIVSFAGLFIQDKNSVKNLVKDYQLGMDLKGSRVISIIPDASVNTVYYDKDGKEVESEAEGGSKKELPVNSEEVLTRENYLASKKIIEDRLAAYGVSEYLVRVDENTGEITLQIPEDAKTDLAVQYTYTKGYLTIEDEDGNVLLDNSDIKDAKVAYNTGSTGSIIVYLNIQFNKNAVQTLKDISTTYIASTDEDGNDTSKTININLDDTTLLNTSFDEEISNGLLSLSIGEASSNDSDLNTYLQEASNLSILLNNGNLPIAYEVQQNRYVQSDIEVESIAIGAAIVGAIILIALIAMIIKYKKNGVFVSVAHIGYMAILLLVIRYANVVITMEGIFAVVISLVLNYIFSLYTLKLLKKSTEPIKKTYNKGLVAMLFILVPAFIIGITLCFSTWLPIYSFGTILFWGILLVAIYNILITRTLLLCSDKK